MPYLLGVLSSVPMTIHFGRDSRIRAHDTRAGRRRRRCETGFGGGERVCNRREGCFRPPHLLLPVDASKLEGRARAAESDARRHDALHSLKVQSCKPIRRPELHIWGGHEPHKNWMVAKKRSNCICSQFCTHFQPLPTKPAYPVRQSIVTDAGQMETIRVDMQGDE